MHNDHMMAYAGGIIGSSSIIVIFDAISLMMGATSRLEQIAILLAGIIIFLTGLALISYSRYTEPAKSDEYLHNHTGRSKS